MHISHVFLAAALVSVSLAPAARAEPVRVAVVGFTGDLPAAQLAELAQSFRGSMSRQANKDVLTVVTREEMTLVYTQRGAPCSPDDKACILEASDAWSGRLFVRGVVRSTSEGVIMGVTLESVRDVLVAAAQTPPTRASEIGTAVPMLVREILDGERAYRERIAKTQPATPPTTTPTPDVRIGRCRAVALVGGSVPGELFVEEGGTRFESAPAAAAQLHWKYAWAHVEKMERGQAAGVPTITLVSSTKDKLVLSFATEAEREGCFSLLAPHKRAQ